jgi:hypothetical protein
MTPMRRRTLLSMSINPHYDFLKDYFTNTWPSSRTAGLDQYYWTGFRLIDEIKENERVLDVGCGVNPFKRHIPNLHGIDITDIGADEVCAIEDYEIAEKKYDVAFCLGSINFGDIELVRTQVYRVADALKETGSRIYWRCNPGHRDHGNNKVGEIPFFNWRIQDHIMLAEETGFEVTEFMPDRNRMYVKWER